MDSNGIATIDFIFTIFLSLIIAIATLSLIENNLNDEKITEENINVRLIVDKVANTINQVNSNNLGNIQEIAIPNNISNKPYYIIIKSNEVSIVFDGKKAESILIPIRLANTN